MGGCGYLDCGYIWDRSCTCLRCLVSRGMFPPSWESPFAAVNQDHQQQHHPSIHNFFLLCLPCNFEHVEYYTKTILRRHWKVLVKKKFLIGAVFNFSIKQWKVVAELKLSCWQNRFFANNWNVGAQVIGKLFCLVLTPPVIHLMRDEALRDHHEVMKTYNF